MATLAQSAGGGWSSLPMGGPSSRPDGLGQAAQAHKTGPPRPLHAATLSPTAHTGDGRVLGSRCLPSLPPRTGRAPLAWSRWPASPPCTAAGLRGNGWAATGRVGGLATASSARPAGKDRQAGGQHHPAPTSPSPVSGSTTRMICAGRPKAWRAASAARRIVSAGAPPRGAMMHGGSGVVGVFTPHALSMSMNSCWGGGGMGCCAGHAVLQRGEAALFTSGCEPHSLAW
jgi:hypothetical protein